MIGLDVNPQIEVPTLRDKLIVPDPEWKSKRIGVRWNLRTHSILQLVRED